MVKKRSQRNGGMGRIGGVFGQPPRGIHERLLEHVLRVDAPLQTPVEPKPHHPAESFAMPGEEVPERRLIPCMDALCQGFFDIGSCPTCSAPYSG